MAIEGKRNGQMFDTESEVYMKEEEAGKRENQWQWHITGQLFYYPVEK